MNSSERIKAAAYLLEMSPENLKEKLNFDIESFKAQRIEKLFKVKDVAEMWGCSIKHLWNMHEKGEIEFNRSTGVTRISKTEVDRIVDDK
ncbi:hypothetical protein LNTAR_15222 [Lentisphaera araneosa HTCC2155]|uniref:Helix-turn-helix domain-containing protein n=1 Tax=Lentisphaera araneosa HTCC2155 TaxID=313628 RepID=A6DRG9_9BACT|nr:helix-turn-helix domain-containing protein [Lentisphaera araneosa]EDM25779.1 hypothetical protein LNTAR_15222 [Lentisphaera araneosa HTCC2155]